jgi:hypothetical protein
LRGNGNDSGDGANDHVCREAYFHRWYFLLVANRGDRGC